uniref:Mitochondrial carrier protein n=1 Tax=Steinernema glaseri TaxID=37863 RepID=A0A1I7YGJ7_9BILA
MSNNSGHGSRGIDPFCWRCIWRDGWYSSRGGDCSSPSTSSSKNPIFQIIKKNSVFNHITHIIKKEGFGALYKGLGPNLVGVAPSKAVYFYVYSSSKRYWNENPALLPDSAIVHMLSAGSAGFVAASVVNPVWLVKTRLQLNEGSISIGSCIRRIYQREGVKGFYKGVTASYMGISETMIQFVLYEYFRQIVDDRIGIGINENGDKKASNFISCMVSGGVAKFFACVMAYPHEVVRTRLREENTTTKGFFSTLYRLYQEGYRSMYRGLGVQLMRTVPNTAITLGTYELVVYVLHQMNEK